MPSVFSHAVVALALGPAFRRAGWPARLWWAGALCAVLPDADVVGIYAGVPLGSVFGHRGLTHSLAFAAALAAVLTPLLLAHGAGRSAVVLPVPGDGVARRPRCDDRWRHRRRVLGTVRRGTLRPAVAADRRLAARRPPLFQRVGPRRARERGPVGLAPRRPLRRPRVARDASSRRIEGLRPPPAPRSPSEYRGVHGWPWRPERGG